MAWDNDCVPYGFVIYFKLVALLFTLCLVPIFPMMFGTQDNGTYLRGYDLQVYRSALELR